MDYHQIFGERLKALRLEKQLTQEDVAQFINANEVDIQDYEHGRNYPTISKFILLAGVFQVSLDYLIGRNDNRMPAVAKEQNKLEPIAQRLKQLRIDSGRTQANIAQAIPCSLVTYQRYEMGTRTPYLKYILMLADCFQITLDELLGVKSTA